MALPSDRSQAKASTGQCPKCLGMSYAMPTCSEFTGAEGETVTLETGPSNTVFQCPTCGYYKLAAAVSAGAVS